MGLAWVFIITGLIGIYLFVTGIMNFARNHGALDLMDKAKYRMMFGGAGILASVPLFVFFFTANN